MKLPKTEQDWREFWCGVEHGLVKGMVFGGIWLLMVVCIGWILEIGLQWMGVIR